MTSAQTKDPNKVDPSVAQLIYAASQDFSRLMSAHIELAKAELKESATHAVAASAMLIVAAVLGFLGFVFLLVTLAYVLAVWLPVWAGFGIVVLLLFIVAAILILIGRAQGLRVKGPERSIEQVEQTKAALESFVPDIPMPAPPSGRQIGAQRSGAPGSS